MNQLDIDTKDILLKIMPTIAYRQKQSWAAEDFKYWAEFARAFARELSVLRIQGYSEEGNKL